MNKIYLILALFLSITVSVNAEDFRGLAWGASRQEIIDREKAKPEFEDKNTYGYYGKLNNIPALIRYKFIGNNLVEGDYVLAPEHSNENAYMDDYGGFIKLLTKKYGDGKETKSLIWKDDLYELEPLKWGFAISLGHLTMRREWETETTDIVLLLYGDNYKIGLGITYSEKKRKDELKEVEQEKSLNDL